MNPYIVNWGHVSAMFMGRLHMNISLVTLEVKMFKIAQIERGGVRG